MPCNAYGINDNYDPEKSHFFPALIKKIIDATRLKKNYIQIWGNGKPKREVIFCDDIADACLYFLNKKTEESLINVGTGIEKSITDYANFIMKHLSVNIKIKYQNKGLKGTPRKLMDSSLAKKYGWKFKTKLSEGLSITINDYLQKNLID